MLSEFNALSEYHPLSEASTHLASKRNLEGNLPCKHVLSALSARSASRFSPSRLNARLALSQSSLTRAKCENGAKCDVEVRKPFLKPGITELKESLKSANTKEHIRVKESSFEILGRFVSFLAIMRFLEVEETSPLLCKQTISLNSSS